MELEDVKSVQINVDNTNTWEAKAPTGVVTNSLTASIIWDMVFNIGINAGPICSVNATFKFSHADDTLSIEPARVFILLSTIDFANPAELFWIWSNRFLYPSRSFIIAFAAL